MTTLSLSSKGRSLLVLSACAALLGYGPCVDSLEDRATDGRIADQSFAKIIDETSEEGGYFWSNNYISNETSYQHVIEELERVRQPGGVYIGVGPNQNFTYIAHTEPSLAFIVDIRRDNLVEHLLFKSLMLRAETRGAYLSRLLGRRLSETALGEDAPIDLILEELAAAPPDESFFQDNLEEATKWLTSQPVPVTERDRRNFELIFGQFFRHGLEIKYDSWRSFFFPSLKEFILEEDLRGTRQNWLTSARHYDLIRRMHQENRIIPLVGDFAGPKALRALGSLLRGRSQVVRTFYVSNVEFYLFRQGEWSEFMNNVRALPIDERSVFIRAYANLHRPHPKMVEDHITVSLVQNVQHILNNDSAGRYQTLWDVVTVP